MPKRVFRPGLPEVPSFETLQRGSDIVDTLTGELTSYGLATIAAEEQHLETMRRMSAAINEARYVGSPFQQKVQRQILYSPQRFPQAEAVTAVDSPVIRNKYFENHLSVLPDWEPKLSGVLLDELSARHERKNKTDPLYAQQTKQISDCVEIKDLRRFIILKTGHGGKNGALKYTPHKDC